MPVEMILFPLCRCTVLCYHCPRQQYDMCVRFENEAESNSRQTMRDEVRKETTDRQTADTHIRGKKKMFQ